MSLQFMYMKPVATWAHLVYMTAMSKEELSVWDWRRIDGKCVRDEATGCLVWQGATNNGYAATTIARKQRLVHRLVAEHRNGQDPRDLVVRHLCNRRACVEPTHLVVGTHKENAADREASDRHYVSSWDPNQPG